MTGYEKRIFKGWEKTAADLLKDKKMLESTLKRVLAHEISEEVLETGEVVNLPVIELLVLKKLGYDLDHPKDIDLKVYSAVLGETKQELNIDTGDTVSSMFGGIAAGVKPNGASVGRKDPQADSR